MTNHPLEGEASKLLKVIISNLEKRGAEAIIEIDCITFQDLAEKYPEFKVAGGLSSLFHSLEECP